MDALTGFVRGIDTINEWIGRTVAWLTLGCVLTCFAVVVLRYVFDMGFPWMQELYVWQHAAVFMAGAGYTMLHRGHVNVDVMYGRLGERGRAWIDILGTLFFLLPMAIAIMWLSWPVFLDAYRSNEISANAGGLLIWEVREMFIENPRSDFAGMFATHSPIAKRIEALAKFAGGRVGPLRKKMRARWTDRARKGHGARGIG